VELWRPNWLILDILDDQVEEVAQEFEVREEEQIETENLTEVQVALPNAGLPIIFENAPNVSVAQPSNLPIQIPIGIAESSGSYFEAAIGQSLDRALLQGLLQFSDPNRQTAQSAVPSEADQFFDTVGLTSGTALEDIQKARATERTLPEAINSNWVGDGSFSEQIALHRSATTDEFDHLNEAAILSLARTYIYYGFGREAKTVLQIGERSSKEREVLRSLAEIVDRDKVTDSEFGSQINCHTDISLWAFLSTEDEIALREVSVEALVLSFKALPNTLQVHLGPRFAESLTRVGASEAAKNVLQRAKDSEDQSIELAIADSAVNIEQGQTTAAEDALSELVDDNQRTTPEAILQFADLRLDRGEAIDSEDLALLDTMRFQHRDEPIALALSERYVRALIQNNEPFEAIAEIDSLVDILPREVVLDLHNQVGRRILEGQDVGVILEYGFSDHISKSSDAISKAIADELRTLGFIERADEIDTTTVGEIIGLLDTDQGGNAEVTSDAGQVQDETQLLESDWQAGNWPSLRDSEDQVLRDAAELRLQEIEPANQVAELATNAEELVQKSESLRLTISSLMERFDVSDDAAQQ